MTNTKRFSIELTTDLEHGIEWDDMEVRRRRIVVGWNAGRAKGFLYFVVEKLKDTTILILLASAMVSLGFGIREDGAKEGWYEGGSILVSVVLVIVVTTVSNLRQERLLSKLSCCNDHIEAMRDGARQKVSIFDVVVGDVVILNHIGDQFPAGGHLLPVDGDHERYPFWIFGLEVGDGMLVTSVGTSNVGDHSPLQSRLANLMSFVGKVGLAMAFFDLLVTIIRYSIGYTKDEDGNWKSYKGGCTDTNSVLESVARDVVAIPEGLLLAVTLTLAYSMKRMMSDRAIVRKLSACETLGSATVICTDKKLLLLPGAKEAINTCRSAGVAVKMITGDDVFTAKAIATECGILEQANNGGAQVVEGEEFRNYTEERLDKVDSIQVLARSSLDDKLLMVRCLKRKGHVVAVIDSDALALREADIGLSMGGCEVASDMVILDDDLGSVVTGFRWGRCVYTNIQKVIQFHLTWNISALVINFVVAASAGGASLTPVQVLWVNFFVNTLGVIALATDRPSKELVHKPPMRRDAPLITNVVWRNLLAQSLYQIVILLTFHFKGRSILGASEEVKNTIVFNTFVLCQVFNEFNSRKLKKPNVFEGLLHKNKLFLGIIGVTIMLQVVMVEFLNNFADTQKLSREQWGICVGSAALSLPIGWLVKYLIPVPETPFLFL